MAVAALQASLDAAKRDLTTLPQLQADNERLRAAIADRDTAMAELSKSSAAKASAATETAAAEAELARLKAELAAKDGASERIGRHIHGPC